MPSVSIECRDIQLDQRGHGAFCSAYARSSPLVVWGEGKLIRPADLLCPSRHDGNLLDVDHSRKFPPGNGKKNPRLLFCFPLHFTCIYMLYLHPLFFPQSISQPPPPPTFPQHRSTGCNLFFHYFFFQADATSFYVCIISYKRYIIVYIYTILYTYVDPVMGDIIIYIYIYLCVCICMCVWVSCPKKL